MKRIVAGLLLTGLALPAFGQSADSLMMLAHKLAKVGLESGKSYSDLKDLLKIGPRMTGTARADSAVEWAVRKMRSYEFDYVWKQPVEVPRWTRGRKEVAVAKVHWKTDTLTVTALGYSDRTPGGGVEDTVVMVRSLAELDSIGRGVESKIVFFNGEFDKSLINTFQAYGQAAQQRGRGPALASYYGAVGAIVRSMTAVTDDNPRTGMTQFPDSIAPIPCVAVSPVDADRLASKFGGEKPVRLMIDLRTKKDDPVISNNVIAELTGSEFPGEIILVGAHLDSWDLSVGAHDNGAGSVQVIEVLRLLKEIGYKPKRSVRGVLFMAEEMGGIGGIEYARMATWNNEKHVAAIESDRGGFTPRGISIQADEAKVKKYQSWAKYLEHIGADKLVKGYGGVDIGPLGETGTQLFGFLPDSHRYFDYHHSALDTIDNVNERELELGAVAMAIFVILLDQYGIQ